MLRITRIVTGMFLLVGVIFGWQASAEAAIVSSLELSGGSLEFDGRHHHARGLHVLDRLLDRDGLLKTGQFQAIGEIEPSITKRHDTFSLFTSGMSGAPPPSAIISGNRISVDLTSLFFGISHGDHIQAWNIGGLATGVFNPDTLEFCLTWDHLFRGRSIFGGVATFFLQGTVNRVDVAAVPISSTAILLSTGLAVFIGLWWRRGVSRKGQPALSY
jgi:hypothetical protein